MNAKHPSPLKPSWYGESVGHYEGDSLVIDTVGLKAGTHVDQFRTPHTDKLHVTERFTRLDTMTLQHTATIEDPEFYTQPWTVQINVSYNPTSQLLEYICQENESDTKHLLENLRKRGIDPSKIP